jgi:uncharacterized YigZ family protein
MEHYSYKTIKNSSQGLLRDRGSKFLAFAFHVTTEAQIQEILDNLRNEYHNASHHCYAWTIGTNKDHFRANDDGEPSGTAGRPVLGQIRKHDLTNILIVVIRYFGGTLLGTGGLINAYRSAAADALANSEIITKVIDELIEVRFPYAAMNSVMKILKEERVDQVAQDFDTDCKITVSIPVERSERLTGRLRSIGKVSVNKLSINY